EKRGEDGGAHEPKRRLATRPRPNGRPATLDLAMEHHAASVCRPGGTSHVSARALGASDELDSAICTTTDVRDATPGEPLRRPFLSAPVGQDLSLVRHQIDADDL